MSIRPISASKSFEEVEQNPEPKKVLKRFASVGGVIDPAEFSTTFTVEEKAMIKRIRNAAQDHNLDPDLLPLENPIRTLNQLHLYTKTSSRKGKRIINEDSCLVTTTKYGSIFAICDGHGLINRREIQKGILQPGEVMAIRVAKAIKEKLIPMIQECNFNTQKAFENWSAQVQRELPKIAGGSTAAIGFFEKINHYFHVATFGDTEFVVFRMHEGVIHPIPMTAEDNWSTPENAERVKKLLTPSEFAKWEKLPPKHRRFPPETGVNVANAFGNHLNTYNNQTAVSQIPRCSLLQVKEGDLILGGCDGVFDFAKLQELIDRVIQPNWDNLNVNLADSIADYVLNHKNSTDNVTVISVRILGSPPPESESSEGSSVVTPELVPDPD